MTSKPDPKKPLEPLGAAYQPSRREILRPAELVGGAGIGAVFVGLVVLLTIQQLVLTLVSTGITFIVVLMVLALFAMGSKQDAEETADILEQDGAAQQKQAKAKQGESTQTESPESPDAPGTTL
ncbi:MAG TPA: hypothetical protein VIP54_03395 [Microterricola sp.]